MLNYRDPTRLSFDTTARNQMLDITDEVRRVVRDSRVKEGIVVVFVPHTTAGVMIQEGADPDVRRDLLAKLDRLIPKDEDFYKHAEGNSDSHLKALLTGSSAQLILEQGRLILGQWQAIYLCEFDGPRTREVVVKVVEARSRELD